MAEARATARVGLSMGTHNLDAQVSVAVAVVAEAQAEVVAGVLGGDRVYAQHAPRLS